MAKNFEHVSHIKSKLPKENINPEEFYGLTPTVDNSDAEGSSPIKVKFPKLPTEDKLIEGEIAVNYLKGHETLSIKNSEKEIVGFVNENEFFQAQEIISSALGQEKNDRIESIAKIEEKLATKANVSDVYTKSEVDSALQIINSKDDAQDAEIALKANSADLATVATSGSYNDLKDKPVIPEGAVVDAALSDTSENPVQNKVVKAAIDAKQDTISDLATIRSGAELGATAYQKPSTGIPASDIADGVIPTVPTNVSAFTNDAGYLTEHQSLDNYYTKDEVYSKTESDAKYATQVVVNEEIAAAVGPLATKEEMNAVDGKFVEVNQKIDDNELVISAALNDLNASIIKHNDETYTKQEVNDLTSNFFDKAIYDSDNKAIIFKNGDDVIATIDATGFIKDGMVSNVEISESNLVITFNTDAGKAPISIALTDIFNPANYYNKTEVDGKLALKADASNVYTKEDADGKFLTEHQSLDNYYTKDDLNAALGTKADKSDTYTKTQVDNALALKQDASTAFSGDYNDLTNKPTIPAAQVNADWDASSGVAQILNKPTNVSVFTNDAGYLTEQQTLEKHYTKLEVDNQFDEIEYTVSASLNDLNARIEEMSSDNTNQFTAINKRITDFDEGIDDLELAVSSSLNDLNTRVETNLSTINSLLNKIDKLTQRVTALEAKTSA